MSHQSNTYYHSDFNYLRFHCIDQTEMGIVLLPLFLVALTTWAFCLILCIRRINDGHFASRWSYLLGFGIFFMIYSLVLMYWSFEKEIWVLSPYFTLPLTNVILPGVIGIVGVFIPKNYKVLNLIGFGFCFSALMAPILLILLDELINLETFLSIRLTY